MIPCIATFKAFNSFYQSKPCKEQVQVQKMSESGVHLILSNSLGLFLAFLIKRCFRSSFALGLQDQQKVQNMRNKPNHNKDIYITQHNKNLMKENQRRTDFFPDKLSVRRDRRRIKRHRLKCVDHSYSIMFLLATIHSVLNWITPEPKF